MTVWHVACDQDSDFRVEFRPWPQALGGIRICLLRMGGGSQIPKHISQCLLPLLRTWSLTLCASLQPCHRAAGRHQSTVHSLTHFWCLRRRRSHPRRTEIRYCLTSPQPDPAQPVTATTIHLSHCTALHCTALLCLPTEHPPSLSDARERARKRAGVGRPLVENTGPDNALQSSQAGGAWTVDLST